MLCFINFGIEKVWLTGGVSRFSIKNFLSHGAEKFRGGTLQCFTKFPVSENLMHKKGISLFSIENFLSQSAEKNCRETLLCFKITVVSKIFLHRLWREGGVSRFSVNFFCLTVPKNFEGCFRNVLVSKFFFG